MLSQCIRRRLHAAMILFETTLHELIFDHEIVDVFLTLFPPAFLRLRFSNAFHVCPKSLEIAFWAMAKKKMSNECLHNPQCVCVCEEGEKICQIINCSAIKR